MRGATQLLGKESPCRNSLGSSASLAEEIPRTRFPFTTRRNPLSKKHSLPRYAQLLYGEVNLRALLTRAVEAYFEGQEKQDTLADLWDMTLQFEFELSGADRSSVAALQNALRKKNVKKVRTGKKLLREALLVLEKLH
jgi:hypothetical protein